ncbi:MAG: hypothetical protein KatS3mg076_2807 [Candidatus Binatia bacterium]|nr:MAG: hypothetical protein KatS3mg076_2807 [Candidatus Binatia bacterium]
MLPRTLDLGCGPNKEPGSFGVDRRPWPGVDLLHDLDHVPWPLPDDTFERVVCSHIVEHVADLAAFFREVHRVSKDGARVWVRTPHFSSLESWRDPGHRHHLALGSFEFFADPEALGGPTFRVERATLTFRKALTSRLGFLLYRLWPRGYEQNLAFLLPARDIEAVLVVEKRERGTESSRDRSLTRKPG